MSISSISGSGFSAYLPALSQTQASGPTAPTDPNSTTGVSGAPADPTAQANSATGLNQPLSSSGLGQIVNLSA